MTQSSEIKKHSKLPFKPCKKTAKKNKVNNNYDVKKAKASLIDAVPLNGNTKNPYDIKKFI